MKELRIVLLAVTPPLLFACSQSDTSSVLGATGGVTSNLIVIGGSGNATGAGGIANQTSGGASTQGGQGGAIAVPADCSQLADTACAALGSCGPFYVTMYYGDSSSCVSTMRSACEYYGNLARPLDFGACAAALAAPNCQAILSYPPFPKICLMPRGSKAAGNTCGSDAECQSLACDKKDVCGTCLSLGALGAACSSIQQCEPGLVCNGSNCANAQGPGDPCSLPFCSAGSACVGGTCQPFGADGAACGLLQFCDEAHGYVCAATCVPMTVRNEGENCDGGGTICKGTLYCTGTLLNPHTCVKLATFNQDCSATRCMSPLICTNNVCTYGEVSACTN